VQCGRNAIGQNQSCKVDGSETRHVAVVLHFNEERTLMSNVYSLLNENMNRHHRKFSYDLDSTSDSAIARHNVELNDPQVRSVFKSLDNLMTSRYVATDKLYRHNIYAIHHGKNPQKELKDIRAKLADDPRRIVLSFHERLTKNNVDLADPRALAAFKAATEILYHFLQLEHDYMRAYLEEAQTHRRLRRARRRQQTLQLSQSKQKSPQEAEGTR
jgi:hypothetical protein